MLDTCTRYSLGILYSVSTARCVSSALARIITQGHNCGDKERSAMYTRITGPDTTSYASAGTNRTPNCLATLIMDSWYPRYPLPRASQSQPSDNTPASEMRCPGRLCSQYHICTAGRLTCCLGPRGTVPSRWTLSQLQCWRRIRCSGRLHLTAWPSASAAAPDPAGMAACDNVTDNVTDMRIGPSSRQCEWRVVKSRSGAGVIYTVDVSAHARSQHLASLQPITGVRVSLSITCLPATGGHRTLIWDQVPAATYHWRRRLLWITCA
jgi:hypothetical protein